MSDHPNRKLRTLAIAACFALSAFSLAQADPFPVADAIGNPTPPAASAKSFVGVLDLTDGTPHTGGVGTGQLVITTMSITNSNTGAVKVLFTKTLDGNATCTNIPVAPGSLQMNFYVQPQSTLAFSYPSGLVLKGAKHNCFTADASGSAISAGVEIDVVGYSQ